jgi:hypothetical protein
MKFITAAAAAITVALAAAPAFAGVVISQQQSVSSQTGERKTNQTVMVQGHKQKIVTGENEVILDLDSGQMLVVNSTRKSYLSIPFPPRGVLGGALLHNTGLNFKKVGKSQKIAGYSCDEYTGTGKTMFGDYTVTECVSVKAPGAKEFYAFQKLMASKLKGTGAAPSGDIPEGIPLSSDTVTRMNAINLGGMSPEQQSRLKQAMANRKPTTTSTVVTSVEEKQLADNTFAVPTGFTKQEMPTHFNMPMPHAKPSAAAPAKK